MLCIEGKLTGLGVKAGLVQVEAVNGSLTARAGITATLTADFIPAALSTVPVEASLTGRLMNAEFTFVCPIDTIKACFSIGGWDNRLGWDNDLGWKN